MTEENKTESLAGSVAFVALLLVPIIATVLFGAVSTGTRALHTLFLLVLVIAWAVHVFRTSELKVSKSLLQVPIAALIVLGLIQLLPFGGDANSNEILNVYAQNSLSLDQTATRLAILKLFAFFLFFSAALVYIDTPQRLRKVVFTIIIFASVMAFIGILQRLASPNFIYGMREVDYANPFASFVNQHHFAAFMEMTIGLTLGLLFGNSVEKDKRLLLIIAVVLMGIAVVLTGSRGGFISLVCVAGFLVALYIRFGGSEQGNEKVPAWRRYGVLVGGSVGLIAFLVVAVVWLGQEGSVMRIGGTSSPDLTNGRIHFWTTTLEIIKDNPIIGVGLEAFGVAFTKYDTWNGSVRLEQAHNDYLQMLADGGIVGFLIVVSFVFLLYKRGLAVISKSANLFRKGTAIGALAGCFGILVHSFFDFPLRTNANMYFFLLLAVLATAEIDYPKLFVKPTLMQPKKKRRLRRKKSKGALGAQ